MPQVPMEPLPQVPIEPSPNRSGLRPAWRVAASLWIGMVAAVAIPLLLSTRPTSLAIATVGIAIVVGAVLFAFVAAEAELQAEIERGKRLLEDWHSASTAEQKQ
jgi:hypothetical protein